MVKNKTTVLILVFKEFLQASIAPLISVLYAKRYHDFSLRNFCFTVPKNFVEEPFWVSENFWYRKVLGIKEGTGITIFRQNCFCLTVPKISVGEWILYCCNNFGYRKSLDKRGGGGREYHNFLSKSFCLTVPKNFVEEPVCTVFQKISGSEKVYG